MNYFQLVHVNTVPRDLPPSYLVAVAIGQSGQYDWTNSDVMGWDCATHREWDGMIDQLIKSLERVRRRGHAKLKNCRFA